MEVLRLHQTVNKNGEIILKGLPFNEGQHVELILLTEPTIKTKKHQLTTQELLNSQLVGLWKDRKDIKDSVSFARKLRKEAQTRKK